MSPIDSEKGEVKQCSVVPELQAVILGSGHKWNVLHFSPLR